MIESTNQDARSSMAVELNKLLATADAEVKGSVSRDLAGFRQLFDKFVTKSGVSVDWDKIEKLPTQSVRFTGQNRKYSFLSYRR